MTDSIQSVQRKNHMIFYLGTLFFVVLNLIAISWTPLPWLDEVMFIDPSVNYALDGEWTTTAWHSFGGETPFSQYPPLYQYLLAFWVNIFGFSILSVRGFNIFVVAIVSLVMFKGLRKINYLENWYTILIFMLLFWGVGLFSWSYRNGRPDMVNLLFSSLFIYNYLLYTKNKQDYRKWIMLFFSVLILLSGLQACPFILFVLLHMYLVGKEYRNKTKQIFFLTLFGFTIAICLLGAHFIYHDHPKSFFWQFSNSATISNILDKIPFLSEYIFPIKDEPYSKQEFFNGILNCYIQNKNYIILLIINISTILFLFIKNRLSKNALEVHLVGVSLLMPLVMFFVGRCSTPYTWTYYFPSVFCCIICIEKYKSKLIYCVYGALTIVFTMILGLPRALANSEKGTYKKITEFVEKQHFEKDVVILSCYNAYYQIRDITRNSYYPVYPIEYIPSNISYILVDETDSWGNVDSQMNHIIEKGSKIIPVDSLTNPKIVLYKIFPE